MYIKFRKEVYNFIKCQKPKSVYDVYFTKVKKFYIRSEIVENF